MTALHDRVASPSPTTEVVGGDRRGVLVAGIAAVVVATAFRAWVIAPAWFFFDDFYFIQQARRGLTVHYLVHPYNGHLMPASWLLTWVNARAGAFDFTYPAVEIVVLSALAGLGFLHLLLTLFGPRRGVLVPLVLALFSPILLPATTWWAAGVNQLPELIALSFGLAAFVRHLRDRRPRDLVASMVWLAVGLAFVERSALIAAVMWLVALMYFASGTVPQRIGHVWRTYRLAVVCQAVLLAAYLAAYVPFAMNFSARSVTSRPFLGVLGNLAGIAFPTGAVGGPLRWHQSGVTQSETNPHQLVVVLAWLVVGAVVWASIRTRRRAARAWLIPLSALLVNALLIAISRAIYFGPEIALDLRFQTEVAFLLPLAVGLAFMPVLGAVESSAPNGSEWRLDTPSTVLPACAVFLVGSVVSAASYPMRNLTDTSPEAYVGNFERDARAEPGRQVLDLPTPAYLWSPFAYPTNLASRMLAPLDGLVDFETAAVDGAWRIDAQGHLVPVEVTESRAQAAQAGKDGCFGTVAGGTTTSWPLDGPVLGVDWFARLDYETTRPVELTVGVGDATVSRMLPAGHHELLAPAGGSYDSVVLTTADGSAPVCLRHLGIVSVDEL
ncbi:MAG TPA: hypothetical protein VFI19_12355 [Nocardioides sp.]|nr:hypothetical protein [Nocardioides sp.]